jgi:hypothetical protein
MKFRRQGKWLLLVKVGRGDAATRNHSSAVVAVRYDDYTDRLVLADYKIGFSGFPVEKYSP